MSSSSRLCREDFDGGPVSLDLIEPFLFLGNLTAATSVETLTSHKITRILTLDTVPLPSKILEMPHINCKYVQISDLTKEDILPFLVGCTEFIGDAVEKEENVLVHCYFGVSRSSTAVIAYVMKSHQIDYNQAFELVKSKRKFVQPNNGFIRQLKLFHRMNYRIDENYLKYKIYRLKSVGNQVSKVKILPQRCIEVVKPDPGITQENPEPIVYRCKKCRRILASQSNLLPHNDKSLVSAEKTPCKSLIFVEPIAWMKDIHREVQGRLNCPKCSQKLGSYTWINGLNCPCGKEISPAFYMVPSKVELSRIVQNVERTF